MGHRKTKRAPTSPFAPPNWDQIQADVLCPLCNYNLRGLRTPRCPECGYAFHWPEVLDPRRRLHPYVFEHHPERNFGSFWRTAVGALLALRFWSSLYPVQPADRRRLVLYLMVGQCIYLLTMSGFYFGFAYKSALANRSPIVPTPTTVLAYLSTLSPRQQRVAIAPHPTTQAYIDAQCPSPTVSGVFRQHLSHLGWLGYILLPFVLPLLWPWGTYASLRLFQVSMRRARIDNTHVLRCVVYSFDIALWAGLYAAAMGTVQLLPAGIGMARVEENFAQGLAAVFVIGGICCLLRLTAAYQLYLRFPHSFLTVLLSQIVVSLLAMNTVVLLMLAFS